MTDSTDTTICRRCGWERPATDIDPNTATCSMCRTVARVRRARTSRCYVCDCVIEYVAHPVPYWRPAGDELKPLSPPHGCRPEPTPEIER